MFIHKSHSKKDLNNIIETFKINIPNNREYKKKELLKLLTKELDVMDEIEPETKYYLFYNIIELKDYLSSCNPKKLLSIKEKSEIIMHCKEIQQYIKNGFHLEYSIFESDEEIDKLCRYIQPYGDIPSVRKALWKLKKHPLNKFKYEPKISKQTQAELDRRELLKCKYPKQLTHTTGKFFISFD
jgi:hypothetical protein